MGHLLAIIWARSYETTMLRIEHAGAKWVGCAGTAIENLIESGVDEDNQDQRDRLLSWRNHRVSGIRRPRLAVQQSSSASVSTHPSYN
jgi:hypothetical protein